MSAKVYANANEFNEMKQGKAEQVLGAADAAVHEHGDAARQLVSNRGCLRFKVKIKTVCPAKT